MLREGVEIAILMQELVAIGDAIAGDDEIGRLVDGDTSLAEPAIMSSGLAREGRRQHRRDGKSAQPPFYRDSMLLTACAAQNLEQNNVADKDPRGVVPGVQQSRRPRGLSAYQSDPDG